MTFMEIEGTTSNCSADVTWRGKLKYIGIRNIRPDAERETMVWKLIVKQARLRKGKSKQETNKEGECIELVKVDPMGIMETTLFSHK